MNKQNTKLVLFFIIGLLTAFLVMYLINTYKTEKNAEYINKSEVDVHEGKTENFNENRNSETGVASVTIDQLTEENTVIAFVKAHRQLPDFYLTKNEARKQGWNPSQGNLCDVIPGKAIGGDHFSNREKRLPSGNQYFEADVNYHCGKRNADRIIFTKNGDVWLTNNHYKSFDKK